MSQYVSIPLHNMIRRERAMSLQRSVDHVMLLVDYLSPNESMLLTAFVLYKSSLIIRLLHLLGHFKCLNFNPVVHFHPALLRPKGRQP